MTTRSIRAPRGRGRSGTAPTTKTTPTAKTAVNAKTVLTALMVSGLLAPAACASAASTPTADDPSTPSPTSSDTATDAGAGSGGAPLDRAFIYEVGPEQARAAADTVSTVQVSGTGRVEVEPDRARVLFSVETEAETAEEAGSRNAERMDAVLSALRATGMPGLELETRGYSLQPRYRRPDSGDAPEIDGFRASNMVESTISAPDSVGVLVDAAIEAGANRVTSLSFLASDTEEARLQALRQAVESARTEAEAIAGALGMSLGRALEVTGGADSPPGPVAVRMEALGSFQSSPTPVEPGSQTISASVTIRYALTQGGA